MPTYDSLAKKVYGQLDQLATTKETTMTTETTTRRRQPIIGYRTMTGAQRYNARMERIMDDCKDAKTRFNASSRTELTTVHQFKDTETAGLCDVCHDTAAGHSFDSVFGSSPTTVGGESDHDLGPRGKWEVGADKLTIWNGVRMVAKAAIGNATREECETEAAFIVRCVNSHNLLVTALREAREVIRQTTQASISRECSKAARLIDTALAAEGKE